MSTKWDSTSLVPKLLHQKTGRSLGTRIEFYCARGRKRERRMKLRGREGGGGEDGQGEKGEKKIDGGEEER